MKNALLILSVLSMCIAQTSNAAVISMTDNTLITYANSNTPASAKQKESQLAYLNNRLAFEKNQQSILVTDRGIYLTLDDEPEYTNNSLSTKKEYQTLPLSIYKDKTGKVRMDSFNPSGDFNKFSRLVKPTHYQRRLTDKSEVKIGMTKNQVLKKSKLGEPQYKNTTINSSGKFDKWTYGSGQYLYFKNDKITSIEY